MCMMSSERASYLASSRLKRMCAGVRARVCVYTRASAAR